MAAESGPFPTPETPALVTPDMSLPRRNPDVQMLAFSGIPARFAQGDGGRFAAGVRLRADSGAPCAARPDFFRCGAEGQRAAMRQKGQQR